MQQSAVRLNGMSILQRLHPNSELTKMHSNSRCQGCHAEVKGQKKRNRLVKFSLNSAEEMTKSILNISKSHAVQVPKKLFLVYLLNNPDAYEEISARVKPEQFQNTLMRRFLNISALALRGEKILLRIRRQILHRMKIQSFIS